MTLLGSLFNDAYHYVNWLIVVFGACPLDAVASRATGVASARMNGGDYAAVSDVKVLCPSA